MISISYFYISNPTALNHIIIPATYQPAGRGLD